MTDLFTPSDETRRERLRQAGWTMWDYPYGRYWQQPGQDSKVTEQWAFAWLERQEQPNG